MAYYLEQRVTGDIDDVDGTVRDALAAEGFGVLTEIDVTATLQEKLGIEEDKEYRILGACIPDLAHQALAEESNLGTLLPCNVVLYETDTPGEVVVSAIDPEAMLSVADNPALDPFAADVRERLERVLENVS